LDREVEFASRRRMRSDPDMVNPVGTSHRAYPSDLIFRALCPRAFPDLNSGLKWRRPA
jgi:hypothetical protein